MNSVHPGLKGCAIALTIAFFSLHSLGFPGTLLLFGILLVASARMGIGIFPVLAGFRGVALLAGATLFLQGYSLGRGGLIPGLDGVLRIFGITLGSLAFILATPSKEMIFLWNGFLRPLRRLGVRSDGWALSMSLALRFLPLFFAEMNRIRLAQEARGIAISQAGVGLLRRPRTFLALLIPSLAMTLRRTEELALVMGNREFHLGRDRSRLREYPWEARENILFLAGLCFLVSWVYLDPAFRQPFNLFQ